MNEPVDPVAVPVTISEQEGTVTPAIATDPTYVPATLYDASGIFITNGEVYKCCEWYNKTYRIGQ